MDDRLEKVVAGLLMQEGEQIVRDMAGHVGDEIHAVLKRHGMMMRTTGGAVSVGVLTAIQILAESIEFARRSMDGDPDDEAMIVAATAHLFVTEARSAVPDLRLAGVEEGLEMAWRDGFNCARNCVSEDEAFCLTEDVEGDAWLDSATAIRAIPVKADDRERA